jgi:hypothetical protein
VAGLTATITLIAAVCLFRTPLPDVTVLQATVTLKGAGLQQLHFSCSPPHDYLPQSSDLVRRCLGNPQLSAEQTRGSLFELSHSNLPGLASSSSGHCLGHLLRRSRVYQIVDSEFRSQGWSRDPDLGVPQGFCEVGR